MTRPTAPRAWARLSVAVGLAAGLLAISGCGSSSSSPATHTNTASRPASTASSVPAPAATAPAPSTAEIVSASSGAVSASMHAGTHHPKADAAWPVRFIVTAGGRPAAASVSYEYMLAGQVVAHRSHYTFRGHFADIFRWPSSAVGYPLTFRAVIASAGATINLDYPVQVRR